MSSPPLFHEVVDAADALSEEEQEALLELLKRRLLERRREALVQRVREAEQEYRDGKAKSMTVDEFMREIQS